MIGALLLHPVVVGGAVSIARQRDGRPGDADAGVPVLVVPDPAAGQVGGPSGLRQLGHCAGGQRWVTLCHHVRRVSEGSTQGQRAIQACHQDIIRMSRKQDGESRNIGKMHRSCESRFSILALSILLEQYVCRYLPFLLFTVNYSKVDQT